MLAVKFRELREQWWRRGLAPITLIEPSLTPASHCCRSMPSGRANVGGEDSGSSGAVKPRERPGRGVCCAPLASGYIQSRLTTRNPASRYTAPEEVFRGGRDLDQTFPQNLNTGTGRSVTGPGEVAHNLVSQAH